MTMAVDAGQFVKHPQDTTLGYFQAKVWLQVVDECALQRRQSPDECVPLRRVRLRIAEYGELNAVQPFATTSAIKNPKVVNSVVKSRLVVL
jgi:hypothetical protein